MLDLKEIEKIHHFRTMNKTKCKCGYSMLIPVYVDKLVCKWCGNYVYRDKKDQFKDKLLSQLREVKQLNKELKDKGFIIDKLMEENRQLKGKINKAIHRIQLLQMDGEVTIRDLGLIVRDLKGENNE